MNTDQRSLKNGFGTSPSPVLHRNEAQRRLASRIPSLLLLNVLLCGCSSTEVSHLDPFCGFVGHEVSLLKATPLTEAGKVGNRKSVPYALGPLSNPKFRSSIEVPASHTVIIESVRDEVVVDTEFVIAYGRTKHPTTGETVVFAYRWGEKWILGRAPWETETVPEVRYPAFRLLPHFNYPGAFRAAAPPTNAVRWGFRPSLK